MNTGDIHTKGSALYVIEGLDRRRSHDGTGTEAELSGKANCPSITGGSERYRPELMIPSAVLTAVGKEALLHGGTPHHLPLQGIEGQ